MPIVTLIYKGFIASLMWGRPVGYAPTTGPFPNEVCLCVFSEENAKVHSPAIGPAIIFWDFEISTLQKETTELDNSDRCHPHVMYFFRFCVFSLLDQYGFFIVLGKCV